MLLETVYQVLMLSIFVILSIKADCDSPPSISNSKNNITDSNAAPYPHGTLVRYDCDSGYKTVGTSRYYTCNNTDWTGGNIRCERIYCSYVEPPENGKIINTPTNEVGTLTKFTCNEGHDMSGSDEMLCRTDRNWNPPTAPTCTARDCGEFGSIQYASLFQDNSETERNHYGSVVEVTCQNGYVLNGPPRVKCEANGQWGKQPTCAFLRCPPYPNINASCVEKTLMLGTFYFILCKEESTRTGPDVAECVDGDWDSEEMACFCDCKLPSYNKSFISISNLNSHGNLPHNTKLKWTCNSGSFKYQDAYILCTDGKLRVFKHGNEISNTDYANVSDISHTTFSDICLSPSTTTSTTTPTKPPTTQLQTTPTSSSGTTESLTDDNTTNSDFSDRPSTSTPGNKTETTTINMGSTAVFMMPSVVMTDTTSRTTPPTTPLQTTLTSSSGTRESFTDDNTTNSDTSDRPSTSTPDNKADCDSPPSISNSKNNITDSNTAPYPHGTLVRYDCNSGYNTVGTSRYYTCNNTDWTGGNIRCERIYCSYVEPPENGKVINTPSNEVGTLTKFACNEGHDMSGSDEMLCRTDGNWNPPTAPTCTARDCGEFGSIQYASLFQDNSETERNHYGSVVEVTCQNGYVLNGPPRVKCEANGQWGKQPTCAFLRCPPYPNINASCVEKTLMLGTFYFILCKEESTRTGPDVAECVDGDWDSEEMACFCDCKLPSYNKSFISISNLNSHGNLPHNTKLKWTCNSGSFKYQDAYILCTDGKLRVFKHGNEISNTDYANVSDISHTTFSDICLSPSTTTSTTTPTKPPTTQLQTTPTSSSGTTESLTDDNTTNSDFSDRPSTSTPGNKTETTTINMGSTAVFMMPSVVMTDTTSRTTPPTTPLQTTLTSSSGTRESFTDDNTTNSDISDRPSTSTPDNKADCDSPPSISNSKNNITDSNTAPYPHGTLVRYDCNSGYNTVGTSRYYTCNNTDWTGGNIRCERIYCSYVEPPENGKVINTPSNEVGTLTKFACNEGHDMSGSDEMLCRTDGNWNPPTAPTCTARDCGEFGSIQYASLFQDNSETERNHYGSVVEVTCQNGYVLNGPPRVKCEANGQWGKQPTCAFLRCPPYPNINASCVEKTLMLGTFYFILCKEESTRTGPDVAECVDGDWDSEEMACFCDCKLPSYNKSFISISNLNSHGNLPHNTKLKWTCNSGSFKYQDAYILCTDGKLRVFKHGNEISNTDYANVSDISHITFSDICLSPSTTTSTTTPTKPPTTQLQTTPTSSSGTTESLTDDNTTNSDFSDRPSTSTPRNIAETTTINMGSTAVFMMPSVVMSDTTSRTTPPTTPLQTTLTSSSGTRESFTDDNTTNSDFSDRPSTSTPGNKTETTTINMGSTAVFMMPSVVMSDTTSRTTPPTTPLQTTLTSSSGSRESFTDDNTTNSDISDRPSTSTPDNKADCDSPPSISNSKNNITDSNTAPYPHGTLVRYDCNRGYNTVGTSRYYTCNNTDWTGGNIRCERIYCSYVEPPENGKVINTPSNEVGTLTKFACNEGHDMSGSDEMLCRTDGNWNPPTAPTCTARDCGKFGSIQYASLFQDNSETERNHYGSVVEVTCQNGYVLNGPPRVKCEANGQWGKQPTCESLSCPPYPSTNASCVENFLKQGNFYFIQCKEESTQIGPQAAECVNGDWDSEEMACFCDCKLPGYNKSFISISNLNSHGNLPHNTKLKWTCNSGSFKYQDAYILCTDGKLRVFKHGNEISNTDYANVSDISHITFSDICLSLSTSAAIKMGSSAVFMRSSVVSFISAVWISLMYLVM